MKQNVTIRLDRETVRKAKPTSPTIGSDHDGIVDCAVAVAAGRIYVVSSYCSSSSGVAGSDTLTTYTAAGVQTTPTITDWSDPAAIAVDGAGKIYVVNSGFNGTNTLTTYTANGARTTPTITGLSDPVGIAVR